MNLARINKISARIINFWFANLTQKKLILANRDWCSWLSGLSLSPLIKGDYPEDAGSIPITTGN